MSHLTGYDLEILGMLVDSRVNLTVVGDIRQSIYSTNPSDMKNSAYKSLNMIQWFRALDADGKLSLSEESRTWRFNQVIASFSDTILPNRFSFESTTSMQSEGTGHDGVFVVSEAHEGDYRSQFAPKCLRLRRTTQVPEGVSASNFGKVKGLTFDRVMIYPTPAIVNFLTSGASLADQTACGLYVGVTRARHSVTFVVPDPTRATLPTWQP